jgi:hypothetical protein
MDRADYCRLGILRFDGHRGEHLGTPSIVGIS